MKRWHDEEIRTKNEWQKHRKQHVAETSGPTDPNQIACDCDEQAGRFRKKHAYGCGKVRCGMCKGHKYPKREKTLEEIQSDVQFKEVLKEYK
jgi:hypothetical protein